MAFEERQDKHSQGRYEEEIAGGEPKVSEGGRVA